MEQLRIWEILFKSYLNILLKLNWKESPVNQEMGFSDLLEEVSDISWKHLWKQWCRYVTASRSTWLSWWGGRLRQVPVDACDSHQFTRFAVGESKPSEQLCLRCTHPPLQPAGQLQLTRLPGNLRLLRSINLNGLVRWTRLFPSDWWEAAGESIHPSGPFRK